LLGELLLHNTRWVYRSQPLEQCIFVSKGTVVSHGTTGRFFCVTQFSDFLIYLFFLFLFFPVSSLSPYFPYSEN
jgi:hypothetical protein